MPHSVYNTEKINELRDKFTAICNTEGGTVNRMSDGSIMCELGNNKIKLGKYADYIEIERDFFKGEPQVKISLDGLEEIIPNLKDMSNAPPYIDFYLNHFAGEKNGEKWGLFIRYGKIWFSSGGVRGSLAYPITKEHQVLR